MSEYYVKELRKIFKVFLLLFFMLWTVYLLDHFNNLKKYNELKEKIKQVELDYKFLKYNTEELEEMK